MIIVPTRVCNTNKCNYCNVYKKDFDYLFFDEINYVDFCDKIVFLSEKNWDNNIRFFWWEPFLKFEIIKNIINELSKKNKKFNFVINTNLSLIRDEYLDYIKENNIKLIISCNWNIKSHTTTRLCDIKSTILLYKNIKQVINHNINYQINILTTPDTVEELYKNFIFLNKKIWINNFNLLPVNYKGWNEFSINIFRQELELIKKDIINKKLNIDFINKNINNNVNLFNSEIVIDSDWNIYPNMVIMEDFFQKYKNKILISNINKKLEDIKNDFDIVDNSSYQIYEIFINKIINNKFDTIIKNDNIVSEIFWDFLKQI